MRIHERPRPTDDTIFAPTRQGRSAPPAAVAGAAASALQSKNIRSLPINCPFYRKFLTEQGISPSSHTTVHAVWHTAVQFPISYCFNASALYYLTAYDFLHFASYTFRLLCISALSRTSFICDFELFSPSQVFTLIPMASADFS